MAETQTRQHRSVPSTRYWNHLECRWETCPAEATASGLVVPTQAEPVDAPVAADPVS